MSSVGTLSWKGDQGRWWALNAERNEALFDVFTAGLLDRASIRPGEHVLDVGCGCGAMTLLAARASHPGRVVGVDISAAVLQEAHRRATAAGTGNLTLVLADAATPPFADAAFDVVLSRFGVLFFEDSPTAFAGLAQTTRPGGRLVFTAWQSNERNLQAGLPLGVVRAHLPSRTAPARSPRWNLTDPDDIHHLLRDVGFSAVEIEGTTPMLRVGADPDDALHYYLSNPIAQPLLSEADERLRARIADALRIELAAYARSDGVWLPSAAWLVTARR